LNIEDELLQLARERENQTQAGLQEMPPFAPDYLQRQLRLYLVSQAENYDRMKHPDDRVPQLTRPQDDLYKLACSKAEFSDGGLLSFNIQLEESRRGWLLKGFNFELQLPSSRNINMVRIELNSGASRDPLRVPRCHFHLDDCQAHIPFPIMSPRLILSLICEHIEPDFGVSASHSGAGRRTRHTP
jgi:hypothetical protein